jgi:hypothetical protein
MLKVNFHKLPRKTILSAHYLKTKENYFFLVNQTKLYKSKLLWFHPSLNTYCLQWYNPDCRQNTNNFLTKFKIGELNYTVWQKGHIIIVGYPVFATFHLFLTIHWSAAQAVKQGNHVMFSQILHMDIGKLRIKNQSSDSNTFIFKISDKFSWFSFCRTYERNASIKNILQEDQYLIVLEL